MMGQSKFSSQYLTMQWVCPPVSSCPCSHFFEQMCCHRYDSGIPETICRGELNILCCKAWYRCPKIARLHGHLQGCGAQVPWRRDHFLLLCHLQAQSNCLRDCCYVIYLTSQPHCFEIWRSEMARHLIVQLLTGAYLPASMFCRRSCPENLAEVTSWEKEAHRCCLWPAVLL